MVMGKKRINVTISIDGEIHKQFRQILQEERVSFSAWVERTEKDIILDKKKEKEAKV